MMIRLLKLSRWLLLIAGLVLGGLFFWHFNSLQAQSVSYEMAGWIWSENYGWISLNLKNNSSFTGCTPASCPNYYSVKVDSGNQITGYGWSENVGWVCFGSTCTGTVPTGGGSSANFDGASGQMTGWAKVVSLGADGWIHFEKNIAVSNTAGQACYNCQPKCLTWTKQCSGDPEVCVDVQPCLEYSSDEFYSCASCFSKTCFAESIPSQPNDLPDSYCPPNSQWPDNSGDPVYGGSDYFCYGCSDCIKSPLSSDIYRIKCNTCSSCQRYGSAVNLDSGSLVGWAWDGDSSGKIGAGWVHLNPASGVGGYVVFPWLETKYGSIYVGEDKNVRQKASTGSKNATYCIFANDIQHISSEQCEERNVVGVDVVFPATDASSQVYRNALGQVDVSGLSSKVLNNQFDKYGYAVQSLGALSGDVSLNGKVYVTSGDLTIGSAVNFLNGVGSNKGSGTIIVKGNLKINANVTYKNEVSPTNLKQLASVAWIVQGDVVIAPSVSQAVGAFLVLGNGAACQDDSAEYPKYTVNGCGVVFSVDPAQSDANVSLTVKGLIVAKAFDFRRNYSQLSHGSERIIYDGRLTANPPPGLQGFNEGLPIIRDFAY